MLEDQDARVRRAAWHTLEDGGKPDDPALDEIIERTLECETDKQVLNFARLFSQGREKRKQVEFEIAAVPEYAERGKCDFCGEQSVPSRRILRPNSTWAERGGSPTSVRPVTRRPEPIFLSVLVAGEEFRLIGRKVSPDDRVAHLAH